MIGQNAAQPACHFRLALPAKLIPVFVSGKQGFLHYVRGIKLAAQPRVDVEPSQ
jgi:hypothetical protein